MLDKNILFQNHLKFDIINIKKKVNDLKKLLIEVKG